MSVIFTLSRLHRSVCVEASVALPTCYTSENDCRKAADAYLDSIGAPRMPMLWYYDADGCFKFWNAAGTAVYIEVKKFVIYRSTDKDRRRRVLGEKIAAVFDFTSTSPYSRSDKEFQALQDKLDAIDASD